MIIIIRKIIIKIIKIKKMDFYYYHVHYYNNKIKINKKYKIYKNK